MGSPFIFSGGIRACAALACGVVTAFSLLRAEEAKKTSSDAPTRHEVWVPTKDLQEVLKKHPNAVLLDRAQYDALIRDAGKVEPDKEQPPPEEAVIEDVKVSARVPGDAPMATLIYEYHIHNLKDGWREVVFPFSHGAMTRTAPAPLSDTPSQDTVLVDIHSEKAFMVFPDTKAWQMRVLTRGKGRHVLRFTFAAPISVRYGASTFSATPPIGLKKGEDPTRPLPMPLVLLELPEGQKPKMPATRRTDGRWEVVSQSSSRSLIGASSKVSWPLFMVTWEPVDGPVVSQDMISQARIAMLYRIAANRITATASLSWYGQQPRNSDKMTVKLPAGASVLRASVSGTARDSKEWRPIENGVEFDSSFARTGAGRALVEFEVPLELSSGETRQVNLPVAQIEEMPVVQWISAILVESDVQAKMSRFTSAAQPTGPWTRNAFQDVIRFASFGDDGRAKSYSVLSGDIAKHPLHAGSFVFDAIPEAPAVDIQLVPDRFSVDADALVEVSSHEVNIVRTLVFHGEAGSTSRASLTLPEGEVFLEVPVNSGEAAIWKQVGRDIEVNWPKGLAAGGKTSLTVRTRRDIVPQAADGTASDNVTIPGIPVSGASRVSGYVALKFDESWKVNVTDTTGLETRDARATPVRGRMAWFGLKDWKLGFDLSRRAPVHDAVVTAYALPRAKQVEIEGQIELVVTGAPLRKFQVKLPPASAALLRVTSPLVGEQTLDAATGVWTFTLSRELMGAGKVRFRLSLPAEAAAAGAPDGTLTTLLPGITLPGARRTAGRWVMEANTDTELAFTTRGVQPLDARQPPAVEGYAPQHRVIAAFSHGGGEHEIRLTATRHDPATLAGMVVIYLRMSSVLGHDGSARHEANFTLRHNGRQFATVRLPEGAGLLSTVVDGKTVKPVKAGANEVRLPLASRIGDAAPIEVKVMYDTPSGEWGGSGRLALTPPTLGDEVPVMETAWKVHAPAGFTLSHAGSGLEEEMRRDFRVRAPGLWEGLFGNMILKKARLAEAPVDFLPGGGMSEAQREESVRLITERLNRIILPSVQLEGVSVEEAVEFLRIKAREFGASGGINMVIKPGSAPSTATISLDLKDVPFMEALRYITELGGMKYKIEPSPGPGMPGAIVVVPISDVGTELYVRQYKVPLAHLLAIKDKARVGGGVPSGPADPFAPAGGVKKPEGEFTEMDAFKAQGIPFPEGAIVRYDRDTQTLVVKNTQPSLDLVESVVDSMKPAKDLYESIDELGGAKFGLANNAGAYYTDKMSNVIFPTVQFQNASVEEAIEFLRIKSKDYDSTERDPSKKGINLIIKPGAAPSEAKITLDLKDVPMSEALRYITELGGMKYKVEPFAVVVVPISEVSEEIYTRTYKVPPDFIATVAQSQGSSTGGGSAMDILSRNGIPFSEGSTAVFIPATSQLIVRNSHQNLELIESYVDKIMADYIERMRNASLTRAKSGLIPLELELPAHGQVLTLKGHQRPREFTLHYLSWERQMARTSLLVLLGATFFWVLRHGRIWLWTFAAVLVLLCMPVLVLPSWAIECHAVLLGWVLALVAWLLWRVACWWRRRTESVETVHGREVVA